MPSPSSGGFPSLGNMALTGLGFVGDLMDNDDNDFANYWQVRGYSENQATQRDQFDQQMRMEMQNRDLQLYTLQNQMRWRVDDAKLAGLHPLAALGVNPASFSGGSVVGGGGTPSPDVVAGRHGQNIARALAANMKKSERAAERTDALADAYTRSQIAKNEAETAYWLSETARNNSAQLGPGRPSGAKVATPRDPLGGTIVDSEVPRKFGKVQAGAPAEVQFRESPGGALVPYPAPETADALDIETGIMPNLPALAFMFKNSVMPNFQDVFSPQAKSLPPAKKGHRWRWSYQKQGWVQVPVGGWKDKVWWLR